jgi:hypothetical protein
MDDELKEQLFATWNYSNILKREISGTISNVEIGEKINLGKSSQVEPIGDASYCDFHTHICSNLERYKFHPPSGQDMMQLIYRNIQKINKTLVLTKEGIYECSVSKKGREQIFRLLLRFCKSPLSSEKIKKWKELFIKNIEYIAMHLSLRGKRGFITYRKKMKELGFKINLIYYT